MVWEWSNTSMHFHSVQNLFDLYRKGDGHVKGSIGRRVHAEGVHFHPPN